MLLMIIMIMMMMIIIVVHDDDDDDDDDRGNDFTHFNDLRVLPIAVKLAADGDDAKTFKHSNVLCTQTHMWQWQLLATKYARPTQAATRIHEQ